MAQDPLVRREPVSASCNRQLDGGLETQKYSLYPKEHPANCPLRWRLSNSLGVYLSWLQAGFSHHTRHLTGDQYIRDVLQPVVVPHLDNHPLASRPVYMDDNARPHSSRAVTVYLVTSVPWPAMSSCAKQSSVGSNIASGMAAAVTTGHLVGGTRRRVEAVFQARGGYTRYWTLNNRCRQVIQKWCFESEMTILSCFLNCEDQYLKWTCFTAKTDLVILWLNIH